MYRVSIVALIQSQFTGLCIADILKEISFNVSTIDTGDMHTAFAAYRLTLHIAVLVYLAQVFAYNTRIR